MCNNGEGEKMKKKLSILASITVAIITFASFIATVSAQAS